VDSFWFCIPHGGSLIKCIVKGRSEILSRLKKLKFREILLADLCKKKLRYSTLSVDFHIKDLIGLGQVESMPTTSGALIRLILV